MVGGAISGYCSTGKVNSPMIPTTTIEIEITADRMGRSIKAVSYTHLLYFYRQPDKLVKNDTKGNYLGQVHRPQKISPSLYFTFSDSLILAHYGEGIGQPQASACLLYTSYVIVLLRQHTGYGKRIAPVISRSGEYYNMERSIPSVGNGRCV